MHLELLKKIAVRIEKKQNRIFTYPVKKQEEYVKHFPVPKDGIERSYFQYCCQMKLYGKVLQVMLNIASIPLLLLYVNKLKRKKIKFECLEEAIYFHGGKPANIIPDSLWYKYSEIKLVTNESACLIKEDIDFLKVIFKRYPFSWLLWLKAVLKVSQYCGAIIKYSPKVIISCDEFSFTSSILTEYCRARGVKLINVMHGEKLYYMRDSFVCYDEYYVWNEYYANLLIELGADSAQFKVEVPDSLIVKQKADIEKEYDYTYYLAAEPETVLKTISDNMKSLKRQGFNISIRPHPRYSDIDVIHFLFEGMNIENVKEVSIEESLLRTKAAISLYSTVLNQAYHSGITVVIDDISNTEAFRKLKELRYVMLMLEHSALSELMEE